MTDVSHFEVNSIFVHADRNLQNAAQWPRHTVKELDSLKPPVLLDSIVGHDGGKCIRLCNTVCVCNACAALLLILVQHCFLFCRILGTIAGQPAGVYPFCISRVRDPQLAMAYLLTKSPVNQGMVAGILKVCSCV